MELVSRSAREYALGKWRRIERVGLSFSRVKLEYVPQSAEGNKLGVVAMGYDIKANTII